MKHLMFHYRLCVQLGECVAHVLLTTVQKKKCTSYQSSPQFSTIGDINPGINSYQLGPIRLMWYAVISAD